MVARLDMMHFRPNLLDDPCGLMPQHHGQRIGQIAGHHMQIGMAHPDRLQPHQHFAAHRLGNRDIFDLHALAHLAKNRRLHHTSPQPLLGGLTYFAAKRTPASSRMDCAFI